MDGLLGVLDEQLAHTLEEIRRMEEALAAGSLTVPGSKQQPIPNRLLGELRAHRMVLLRLLGVAGDPPAEAPPDPIDEIRRSWAEQHGS